MFTASISQADVSLKDTHGNSTQFSQLKGKWVILNFWAGWCESCVEEIPELNRFYKNIPSNVVFYGVNQDAMSSSAQKAMIKKLNIQYPVLLSNPARALKLGNIVGIPATFVFNPEGKLVKKMYGNQTSRSLSKIVKSGKK